MNQGIYGMGNNTASTGPFGINGVAAPTTVQVLTVGGGGSGGPAGTRPCGGGGGGGVAEYITTIILNTSYTISIGAGGAISGNASLSRFGNLVGLPGGAGNNTTAYTSILHASCATGAGVPGAFASRSISMCSIQGGDGGYGVAGTSAGGGGGAGGNGGNSSGTNSGNGGVGRTSTIPITPTIYGGGGGGGGKAAATATNPGTGGSGGGGTGSNGTSPATNGTSNLGGGGGGASLEIAGTGGTGGSGIVVLRFNNALLFRVGAGLTYTLEISGSDCVLTFTAGTGTITFY